MQRIKMFWNKSIEDKIDEMAKTLWYLSDNILKINVELRDKLEQLSLSIQNLEDKKPIPRRKKKVD